MSQRTDGRTLEQTAQMARSRALRRLAARHQAEFDELVEEERHRAGLPARGTWKPPGPRVALPDEQIARLYRAGASISNLAVAYGVADLTIRRRLVAQGVTIRSR